MSKKFNTYNKLTKVLKTYENRSFYGLRLSSALEIVKLINNYPTKIV